MSATGRSPSVAVVFCISGSLSGGADEALGSVGALKSPTSRAPLHLRTAFPPVAVEFRKDFVGGGAPASLDFPCLSQQLEAP